MTIKELPTYEEFEAKVKKYLSEVYDYSDDDIKDMLSEEKDMIPMDYVSHIDYLIRKERNILSEYSDADTGDMNKLARHIAYTFSMLY